METQNTPDVAPRRKLSNLYLVTLTILLLILACLGAIFIAREIKIQWQLASAQALINQHRIGEAIHVLDDVIAKSPNRVKAYELRSSAFGNGRSNVFTEQQSFFLYSLYDLEKLTELEPKNGDHYVNKNLILRELAGMENDSATKFAIYEFANENAEKAIELGVSPEYAYVYRHHARNLIESNHCEEGLSETQALVSQTTLQDPMMNTYNIYLTEAYICLNELDKALVTAQQIQCDDPVATCRSGFLAEIYYQIGEREKALEILNNMLQANSNYGAWRYFIRADIDYEMGNAQLAMQDLSMGQNFSWYPNGVYWWVNAKMAFDKGDNENGILYLQYAESTLDIQYSPLRQKILAELKDRGGNPLVKNGQLPFKVKPIP